MTTMIRFDDHVLDLIIENLPALTGSEKQVAWADCIRRDLFQHQIATRFCNYRRDALAAKRPYPTETIVAKLMQALAPLYDRQTSARWWIDHRNCDLQLAARSA